MQDPAHIGSGRLQTPVSKGLHVGSLYKGLKCSLGWSVIFSHLCSAEALPFRLGAIIGQLFVGLVCDRVGRKVALISTTMLIVLGATLGTAAHGAHGSAKGLFWFMTFARGLTGIVRASEICFVLDLIRFVTRVSVANILHRLQVPARQPMNKCPAYVAQVRFRLSFVWRHLMQFMRACSVHHGNKLRPLCELPSIIGYVSTTNLILDSSVDLWPLPYSSSFYRSQERITYPQSGAFASVLG